MTRRARHQQSRTMQQQYSVWLCLLHKYSLQKPITLSTAQLTTAREYLHSHLLIKHRQMLYETEILDSVCRFPYDCDYCFQYSAHNTRSTVVAVCARYAVCAKNVENSPGTDCGWPTCVSYCCCTTKRVLRYYQLPRARRVRS